MTDLRTTSRKTEHRPRRRIPVLPVIVVLFAALAGLWYIVTMAVPLHADRAQAVIHYTDGVARLDKPHIDG
jgi:hypothetical protein